MPSAATALKLPQHHDWESSGERQVSPTLDGIRRDHVARYEWAAKQIGGRQTVIDVGCGIGYGAKILAESGAIVVALDAFGPAIAYAREHYSHPGILHRCEKVQEMHLDGERYDAAVCFEMLEHVPDFDALATLIKLRRVATTLYASVPNDDEIPFGRGFPFHHRHYTRQQFEALLNSAGWTVRFWHGQIDHAAEVTQGAVGRTLIAVCQHRALVPPPDDPQDADEDADESSIFAEPQTEAQTTYQAMVEAFPVPNHVAILGLGPSLEQYVDFTKRLGGKHAYCDEVWGINALGGVLLCDRIFHMDDVRVQEVRAAAQPESNIARMLQWLRVHPGPIITSREHPDYPGLVAFPLQDVLNSLGQAYFNSTAAYAVAYAIHIGVKHISLFGCDFTYPNSHDAEKGRGCVEFWLGIASAKGIKLSLPKTSSLLDGIYQLQDRFYGYDTLAITLRPQDKGRVEVDLQPIDTLPTAEEIEQRYDHSQHPNKLISG
jgi:SAM-dependent methyltransferase